MASRARSRVLLIGEQTLVLEALRHCLEGKLDVDGHVSGMARIDDALHFRPDAAVIHLPASRNGGLDQLRRFRETAPGVAVVVLATDEDPRLAARAFRLGVHGWVLKSSTVPDLAAAVRGALAGRRHLSPRVAGGRIDALPEPAGLESPLRRIRPRERQVLRLLGEGLVMREIGAELGITTRTVAFHKYRMMETLGVRSTAALLRLAVREQMAGQRIEG